METQITYTRCRTARARIRDSRLVMTIPRHWPRVEQEAAIAKFRHWGQKQSAVLAALPQAPRGPSWTLEDLCELVDRVNRETVAVSYAGVRIGQARYSRLAQVNLNTRILTFSCFAIDGMPERALRYLILHELAHLKVPNHSRSFWTVVARYMPDYRHQRQVAQHHFQLAGARTQSHSAHEDAIAPAPIRQEDEPQQLRLF